MYMVASPWTAKIHTLQIQVRYLLYNKILKCKKS